MTFGQKYNLDKVKRKMIFEKTVFYDILYLSYIIPDLAKSTVVSFVVMASTYFGSAAISNIILSLKGMI